MGEMVRRMEYERRARSMMKQQSKDKLIAKEYTQSVRAANSSVTRSLESVVKKVNLQQRSFRERYSKNLGNIHAFKKTLSSRSLDFDDGKFNPDSRLVLPLLSSGNQDGGMFRRPDVRRSGYERRQSCLSISDLVERTKKVSESSESNELDESAPSTTNDIPVDLPRRNSVLGGRRLSNGGQNDSRSFRVLKEKFLPNHDGELDTRSKRILDCKAAEQRRGSFLSERIQQLYSEVEQT